MKKYTYALIFMLIFSSYTYSQQKSIDTIAVTVIDRMSTIINELDACSFQVNRSMDVHQNEYGLEKEYFVDQIFMKSPDKMHVEIQGSQGHRGYWYNGNQIVYYSFKENNYSVLDAPSNIVSMMDSIHQNFGIEFPAADIFYPNLSDDILESFDNITFLGEKVIDGQPCYHIMATNQQTNLQLWISNTSFMLPKKMVIIHKDDKHKQYEATFSNWKLNPELPDALFEFTPPPKAKNISIMAKS